VQDEGPVLKNATASAERPDENHTASWNTQLSRTGLVLA